MWQLFLCLGDRNNYSLPTVLQNIYSESWIYRSGAHLESFGRFAAASERGYMAFNSLIPHCSEPHQTVRGDWERQKWLPCKYQPYRSDYPMNAKVLHFSVILLRMFLCSVSNSTPRKSSWKISQWHSEERACSLLSLWWGKKRAFSFFFNQWLYFVYI